MAGLIGVTSYTVTLMKGGSQTIDDTPRRGLVMISFSGTSTASISFWLRNEFGYNIYTHQYFSQGTIQEGKISLSKDSNSRFVVTNDTDSEKSVVIKVISI